MQTVPLTWEAPVGLRLQHGRPTCSVSCAHMWICMSEEPTTRSASGLQPPPPSLSDQPSLSLDSRETCCTSSFQRCQAWPAPGSPGLLLSCTALAFHTCPRHVAQLCIIFQPVSLMEASVKLCALLSLPKGSKSSYGRAAAFQARSQARHAINTQFAALDTSRLGFTAG